MKTIIYIPHFTSVTILTFSCEKEEMNTITVEGFIRNEIIKEPLAGIAIEVDAIKSLSGMGITFDGKRKRAG